MLCVAAAILTNGNPFAAILPVVAIAGLWFISVAPVRTTVFVLFFLSLATDRPGDANGLWESPFVDIGGLLAYNMSKTFEEMRAIDPVFTFPTEGLKFSAFVLMLALLLTVRLHRVLSGRLADTPDAVLPAPPINWAIGVSVCTLVFLVAWGLANGGNAQTAKMQAQVFLPLLGTAFLLGPALRGSRDYRTLARIILVAACCKAVMALWVRNVLPESVPDDMGTLREVEFATSHGDSLLFACAFLIMVAPIVFKPTRRHVMWCLGILPLLVAGMIANDRRLVWVELGVGVVLMLLMNPRSWAVRRLVRTVVAIWPILLIYGGVGWVSTAKVFEPVKILRSLVTPVRADGYIDRSTLFRDVENYNLIYTFSKSPIIGSGFGHAFDAPVANDNMSAFADYPFLPHNSLLGLMGFAGGLGVMGLFTPLVVALYFAARSQLMTRSPDLAMAAAVVIGNIAAYVMHLWGDIGFTEPTSIVTVGTSLAIAGQLAVSTGAWRIARAPGGLRANDVVRQS